MVNILQLGEQFVEWADRQFDKIPGYPVRRAADRIQKTGNQCLRTTDTEDFTRRVRAVLEDRGWEQKKTEAILPSRPMKIDDYRSAMKGRCETIHEQMVGEGYTQFTTARRLMEGMESHVRWEDSAEDLGNSMRLNVFGRFHAKYEEVAIVHTVRRPEREGEAVNA